MIPIDWNRIKEEVSARERISGDIAAALDECIDKAKAIVSPKYIRAVKKITGLHADSIEIEGGIKFSTANISSYIKDAAEIVLFLVTIGDGIEKEAGLLTSGKDPLKGYLLDRIGSYAVESLAENLEDSLRKEYAVKNRSLSRRFSPGYCDWALEEQFKIYEMLDFSRAGVTLTEGCMMVPKKSISAIAAVADKGVFTGAGSNCDVCNIKDCGYRRAA